ncbi:MAG: hypothetical protein ACRDLF_06390 [Solirubrobacteraceae bacterium]
MQAANAGGTAVEQTTALPPIKAAPAPKGNPPSEGGSSGSPPPPPPPVPPAPVASAPAAAPVEEISLAGKSLSVSGGVALARLECSGGTAECAGKLTLTAKEASKAKHGRRSSRTVTIGTAKFTIAPQQTTAVKLDLDAAGRALLSAGHGELSASLTILELAPQAGRPQAQSVRLVLERHTRKARKRKQ